MNCREFEKLVFTLVRQGRLDAATCEPALAHQTSCVRCAKRLAEAQALLAGMRAVAVEISKQEAPPRLEAALRKAFREQAGASAAGISLPTGASPRAAYWKPTAIAAGFFILFSLVVFFWQQARARNHQHQIHTASSAPFAVPQPPAPQGPAVSLALPHQVAERRSPRNLRQQRPGKPKTESVTEFFPLMEGDGLEALDSGQIVRIELSGSALLDVGLPVDVAMANEPVKADVVLGNDGLARAIRFVRQSD